MSVWEGFVRHQFSFVEFLRVKRRGPILWMMGEAWSLSYGKWSSVVH